MAILASQPMWEALAVKLRNKIQVAWQLKVPTKLALKNQGSNRCKCWCNSRKNLTKMHTWRNSMTIRRVCIFLCCAPILTLDTARKTHQTGLDIHSSITSIKMQPKVAKAKWQLNSHQWLAPSKITRKHQAICLMTKLIIQFREANL